MEITLNELLNGKATRIKDNNFFSTEAYVTPFLERMQKFTTDFRVQVKLPSQLTYTTEGNIDTDDITYNRVYIQAVLPEQFRVDNHDEVIGMVYGIDTRKPVAKFFKGALNCACTNLCVFNPDALAVQEMTPDTAINYRPLTHIIELTNTVQQTLDRLRNTEFTYSITNINENLGSWVRKCISSACDVGFGKVKLATSTAIDAYKLLFVNDKSPYYVAPGTDTDMFNVYNAFTQLITDNRDKDLMNEFEKTILVKDILGLD